MTRTLPLALLLGLQGCALLDLAAIRRSFPPHEGTFATSVGAPVTVSRDDLAVPHVRAATEVDAWHGLGFVHGQDRFFQADLLRRLAWGRVATWFGEDAADLDAFVRALGLRRRAEVQVGRLAPETRAMLEAYAAGMNAGLGTLAVPPIEYRLLDVEPEPWEPVDAYAVLFMMSWDLAENLSQELAAWTLREALSGAEVGRLFAFTDRVPDVDPWWDDLRAVQAGPYTAAFEAFTSTLGGRPDSAEASNNWVVGGSRTASGLPILANDPHLLQGVPPLWYFADVAGGDLHVAGATLPGLPGFPVGHNGRLAWGLTNVMADVVDVVVLERTDDGYVLGGEVRDLEAVRMEIEVGGGATVPRTVLRTEVGPLITEDEGTHVLTLRWHAAEVDDRTPDLLRAIARAPDVGSALELGGTSSIVAQHIALADVDGDYAVQGVGSVPRRRAHTGRVPYPGSDPAHGWDGWYPRLPGARTPPEGFVVSANTRHPWELPATGEGDPIDVEGVSTSWVPPHRYDRIVELLEGAQGVTAADVARQQLDVLDVSARALVPRLLAGVDARGEAAPCRDALASWDFRWTPDSVGAAVWATASEHLLRRAVGARHGEGVVRTYLSVVGPARSLLHGDLDAYLDDRPALVADALADACAELRATLGRKPQGWTWGALHPLRLQHRFAVGRKLLKRWNLPEVPFGGAGTTVAAAGYGWGPGERAVGGMASLRLVVPLDDPGAATLVQPGGQSGHPRHPDVDTHFDAFVDGATLPLRFHDEDVAAHAVGVIELVPE